MDAKTRRVKKRRDFGRADKLDDFSLPRFDFQLGNLIRFVRVAIDGRYEDVRVWRAVNKIKFIRAGFERERMYSRLSAGRSPPSASLR